MALAAKSLDKSWNAHLVNIESFNQPNIHLKKALVIVRLRQTIRLTLGELMGHDRQGRMGRAKRIHINVGTAKHERESLILCLRCGP